MGEDTKSWQVLLYLIYHTLVTNCLQKEMWWLKCEQKAVSRQVMPKTAWLLKPEQSNRPLYINIKYAGEQKWSHNISNLQIFTF